MWDYLKPGGKIAVIAPAGRELEIEKINYATEYFLRLGFVLKFFGNMSEHLHFFHSDTDEKRADALIAALESDCDVIITLRGGYGCAKVIAELERRRYKPHKEKAIVGFSDVTVLLTYFYQRYGWQSVHGPGILHYMGKDNRYDERNLEDVIALLTGERREMLINDLELISGSVAPVHGKLVGGCLSLIQTTIGTQYQIDCKDKILFLEDIDEPGRKIDRMLHHVLDAGLLDGVRAIVYGNIHLNNPQSLEEQLVHFALRDFAKYVDLPIYQSQSFGHGRRNMPIVIGADAVISNNVMKFSLA